MPHLKRCTNITRAKGSNSPGRAGRPRCAIRARRRSPISPRRGATASNSFSSCSGKPTASSPRQQLQAREAGLSIGIYRDLAVGADPNGAEAWADQELVAPGASIGAPPDQLSRGGQNWGLAPVNPLVFRRQSFAPLVASLRANMRHAGILRIDHVMSLNRLYWIPSGMPATEGAYVNYPFDDLLRLVALESQRQRCAVVGEDLGTVPEGFRDNDAVRQCAFLSDLCVRTTPGRQLCAAGKIPGAGCGLGRDPRHRHAEGFLARRRYCLAQPARPLSGRSRASRRDGRARPAIAACCSRLSSAKGCFAAEQIGEFLSRKPASRHIRPSSGKLS